jgi:hypothetical protein
MCAFLTTLLAKLPEDVINEDAYMATIAECEGLGIFIDKDAIVHVKPPTSIVELADQKRRIAVGHKQVVKKTGYFPTVLATSWWVYPNRFRQLIRRRRPRKLSDDMLVLREITGGVTRASSAYSRNFQRFHPEFWLGHPVCCRQVGTLSSEASHNLACFLRSMT